MRLLLLKKTAAVSIFKTKLAVIRKVKDVRRAELLVKAELEIVFDCTVVQFHIQHLVQREQYLCAIKKENRVFSEFLLFGCGGVYLCSSSRIISALFGPCVHINTVNRAKRRLNRLKSRIFQAHTTAKN